jgi:hypothetical protein
MSALQSRVPHQNLFVQPTYTAVWTRLMAATVLYRAPDVCQSVVGLKQK